MRRATKATVTAGVGIAIATLLSGCSPTVSVEAAPESNSPKCAEVSVRLPDSVEGQAKRTTDSQATAAWGDPTAVLLRCGVESPGPTTDQCVSINNVDWVEKELSGGKFRYTTYGRTPAAEVIIDSKIATRSATLVDLAEAVKYLPQKRHCT